MKLLLDTQAWHWAAVGDGRLSATAFELIDSPRNERFLSVISLWEFKIHVRRKRIVLDGPANIWIAESIRLMRLTVLDLTPDIVLMSEDQEDFPRADPADRFIVATAMNQQLPLVSSDMAIQKWGRHPVLW